MLNIKLIDMKSVKNDKIISRRNLWQRLVGQRYLQAMAIPGAIFMIIFSYLPMYGIVIAFKNYKITRTIAEAPWVGLEHFKEFFNTPDFLNILTNTLGISCLKLVIAFPIAIVFAIMVNELAGSRYKRVVQTVSYLPHFVSWVILGGMMITWLGESGIVNEIFMNLGLINEPIVFLADPNKFWTIALVSDMWKETGWSAIIFLAAISGIDPTLYEAATVDGVGRFKKIWYITLPCIAGTIAIMFIMAVSGLLSANFDQMMVLKNSLNVSKSEVIDTYVYYMGIRSGRFSYATAAGLMQSIVAMILLVTANQVSKKLQDHSLF